MKKIKAILTTMGVLSFALLPAVGFAQLAVAQSTPLECGTRNGTWDNGTCTGADEVSDTTVNDVIKKIINILSWVVGVISVIMIIIAGFRYVTSGGQEKGVTGAKNTIMYAIIGLVVVALAQVIVRFVISNIGEV
jgi:magnesium-transporting ATPase (P-type)